MHEIGTINPQACIEQMCTWDEEEGYWVHVSHEGSPHVMFT